MPKAFTFLKINRVLIIILLVSCLDLAQADEGGLFTTSGTKIHVFYANKNDEESKELTTVVIRKREIEKRTILKEKPLTLFRTVQQTIQKETRQTVHKVIPQTIIKEEKSKILKIEQKEVPSPSAAEKKEARHVVVYDITTNFGDYNAQYTCYEGHLSKVLSPKDSNSGNAGSIYTQQSWILKSIEGQSIKLEERWPIPDQYSPFNETLKSDQYIDLQNKLDEKFDKKFKNWYPAVIWIVTHETSSLVRNIRRGWRRVIDPKKALSSSDNQKPIYKVVFSDDGKCYEKDL